MSSWADSGWARGSTPLGVDGLHLVDQVEDVVEFGLRVGALVRGQFDSGQPGNAGHICVIERHGECEYREAEAEGRDWAVCTCQTRYKA